LSTANGSATEPVFWAAPDMAKAGYPVFPVNQDKNPTVEGGFYAATTDASQIAEWIMEGREHHDVAFATGIVSGVVVLDADTPEAVARMEANYGEPTVRTRRGAHWYFRHPRNGKVPSRKVAEDLDCKGDGGYVVAPPSRGRTWVNGIPDRAALPVLPAEFHKRTATHSADEGTSIPEELQEKAVEAIARHVKNIKPGSDNGRHQHLKHLCGVLLSREVSFADAEAILMAAWKSVGGELAERAEREVPNTLRTTQRAIAEGRATGGPSMEKITPGLYAELEEIFGWRTVFTVGGKKWRASEPHHKPWPELDGAALYGLPGDVVQVFEPHTEADPVAVLANFLCAFGSVIGRGAFAHVGATEHHLKLFVGLVGETAKGRKGESWGPVKSLKEAVDPGWASDRVMGGLSSGEGLIFAVRDEVRDERKGEEVVLDSGEPDKRLLAVEGELAGLLKVMAREGNTLSSTIRQAWDGDRLRTMTKNSPTRATGAHVSIIGHITKAELLRHLSDTEAANGFANRFLWLMVRRSKELPFGGEWKTPGALVRRLDAAVRFARTPRVVTWGTSARGQWAEVYGPLSEGKPGLFGAVTGRAEAQTLRLAALYAATDQSASIEREHLEGALALWDYAEESARYIFGDATGDPVADAILQALRNAGDTGLTWTEIRDLFKRHQGAERINAALGELLRLGRVERQTEQTGGRPTERWVAR
jgi:Bifunctional DNA primase/polymerase, N-terminal/Protein of unknown function (DUF3987)